MKLRYQAHACKRLDDGGLVVCSVGTWNDLSTKRCVPALSPVHVELWLELGRDPASDSFAGLHAPGCCSAAAVLPGSGAVLTDAGRGTAGEAVPGGGVRASGGTLGGGLACRMVTEPFACTLCSGAVTRLDGPWGPVPGVPSCQQTTGQRLWSLPRTPRGHCSFLTRLVHC